jgi:hypothetical protein
MNHCVAKIVEIVTRRSNDRRSILQLGYNLGRLSELTGLGREPFWDRWKDPVENWDIARLEALVQELQRLNFPLDITQSAQSQGRTTETSASFSGGDSRES